MATTNQIGVGLKGSTGSGTFVGSDSPILTSPTLVTPTLGVASATSVNFGGGALSTYVPGTSWTPSITFTTPGDLSVSYSAQLGFYEQIGKLVFITLTVGFTPTYTTASGAINITGIPVARNTTYFYALNCAIPTNSTWPAGRTVVFGTFTGGSTLQLLAYGTGTTATNLGVAAFPSGVANSISISGTYLAA